MSFVSTMLGAGLCRGAVIVLLRRIHRLKDQEWTKPPMVCGVQFVWVGCPDRSLVASSSSERCCVMLTHGPLVLGLRGVMLPATPVQTRCVT